MPPRAQFIASSGTARPRMTTLDPSATLKPQARFNVSECRARGLSVYARHGDAVARSRKRALRGTGLPGFFAAGRGQHPENRPARIIPGGRLADFDILANSR